MRLGRIVRKWMETWLRRHHYEVRHESEALRDCTMAAALARAARRGLNINSVIDVGASDGAWTRLAMEAFPGRDYLLIEANPIHAPALEALSRQCAGVRVVHAAAGEKPGKLYFNNSTALGGAASRQPLSEAHTVVDAVTVDQEVNRAGLQPGYCLKLDTHGFEVPIFNGAADALKQTELIVVEVYNFQISPEALRFHRLCDFLEDKGFRVIDIADPGYRPRDLAFWQMDLFFARADRPEFASDNFR